jgi:hypothetical protein
MIDKSSIHLDIEYPTTTLGVSTLIILFSKMLKFSTKYFLFFCKNQNFVKEIFF